MGKEIGPSVKSVEGFHKFSDTKRVKVDPHAPADPQTQASIASENYLLLTQLIPTLKLMYAISI